MTNYESNADAQPGLPVRFHYFLPSPLEATVQIHAKDWAAAGKVQRLWNRDASVWTGADESKWLGWLDIVERQQADEAVFAAIAADVKQAGFEHALLLGMGG